MQSGEVEKAVEHAIKSGYRKEDDLNTKSVTESSDKLCDHLHFNKNKH